MSESVSDKDPARQPRLSRESFQIERPLSEGEAKIVSRRWAAVEAKRAELQSALEDWEEINFLVTGGDTNLAIHPATSSVVRRVVTTEGGE